MIYQSITPSSICLLLSQIFVWPILVQTASCLCPETSKYHLSWFNFIKLFSNHSTATAVWCSSLLIKVFKFCHILTLESRIIVPPPPHPPIVNFSIFFYPGHLYSNLPIFNFQSFLLTFLSVNSHFHLSPP